MANGRPTPKRAIRETLSSYEELESIETDGFDFRGNARYRCLIATLANGGTYFTQTYIIDELTGEARRA